MEGRGDLRMLDDRFDVDAGQPPAIIMLQFLSLMVFPVKRSIRAYPYLNRISGISDYASLI